MPEFSVRPWMRRLAADFALWIAIGVVMAFLGPFETARQPLSLRFAYWLLCMVGGGLIGVAIDEPLRRRVSHFWSRLVAASVLMTPPVTILVGLVNHFMFGDRLGWANLAEPAFQVFVVCIATMCLRQLAWAQAVRPPLLAEPEAPRDPTHTFRQRLSAKRRGAELIAVEAEDHYLRVHTDAGQELITARFGDALKELDAAPGFRTHRSWWVATGAIDEVKWLRGRGEAKLKCGLVVPISRSNAAPLKAAGWF
ncbi:LytTR family DNA-binding domain-containing protein [Phenylobacterium sp.]|uniref:LytTR family DNA-binding domain-containing protein n=1 Tax=Phenylobacterium sp. TaxID=1871053 RepID=UPI0025E764DE|nr:LytTR family DNA-binding domain-containing protein [Phenylobacterium sp.]